MCKTIAVVLCILFAGLEANAQGFSSNKISSRFEFIAGPSFSNNNGYLPDYDSKVGYSLGVGYYQKLSKSFSVNVRSLYEMKGSAATYRIGYSDDTGTFDVEDTYTTKFNYLTFYLLPTLQIGRNKNIYISAGGYYSLLYKLSVNIYRIRPDTGEVLIESTNTDKNYFDPDFDAGVSFQLGYSFKVSDKCQFMAQAFINRGLVDLYNTTFGSQRNNTFGLLLSMRIR